MLSAVPAAPTASTAEAAMPADAPAPAAVPDASVMPVDAACKLCAYIDVVYIHPPAGRVPSAAVNIHPADVLPAAPPNAPFIMPPAMLTPGPPDIPVIGIFASAVSISRLPAAPLTVLPPRPLVMLSWIFPPAGICVQPPTLMTALL